MKWLAPAKINLSLRVLGRRADGFHDIETLMVPLSLADEITITPRPEEPPGSIELVCSDPTIPTGEGNLAYRAAALFKARAGNRTPAVRIHLIKHIPHGAGLGGGSSDAATVLLALNDLCGSFFSVAELAAQAAELGSDIPFFIYQSAAKCRGRGERVEPLDFPASLSLLLLKPVYSIPTPWAYKRWQDSREIPGVRYSPQSFEWGELVNDLERPVFEKYLALAELKTWLIAQSDVSGALLSGSGSTMIAVLSGGVADARTLCQRVQARFGAMWMRACTTAPMPPSGTSKMVPKPENLLCKCRTFDFPASL